MVEFRWSVPGRNDIVVYPRHENNRLVLPEALSEIEVSSHFFAANRTYSAVETAQRFSTLSKTFKEPHFIELFHKHFPAVSDLSIELSAGYPWLFASVRDVPEKIPLGLASGGMSRLASILLASAAQPRTVILIDEIETGFHHSRLKMIWETLLSLTKEYDSQIFASTHSAECLEAAATVAAEYPFDFSIVRPTVGNGDATLRQFDGNKFVAVIEGQLDIR